VELHLIAMGCHTAGLRRGAFTCFGWQVSLCDPIWQVIITVIIIIDLYSAIRSELQRCWCNWHPVAQKWSSIKSSALLNLTLNTVLPATRHK